MLHFEKCLLVGAFLVAFIPVMALRGQDLTYALVAPGEATPDGQDTIDSAGSFAFSDTGVAFEAHLKLANTEGGVFTANQFGLHEVLEVGQVLPGIGTVNSFVGNIVTNEQTQALVYAGINGSQTALIAGNSSTTARAAVITGEMAPNQLGAFTSFTTGNINNLGDVAFDGFGNGFSGTFISAHDGTLSQLAVSGQNAPGENYPFDGVGSGTIRDTGKVLISAEIHDTHWGTGNNYGIYSGSVANGLVKIARSYDPAPGTSYLLGWVQSLDMNDAGQAVVYAYLINSQGGFYGQAIYAGSSSANLVPIAYKGQSAPGNLGHYTNFDNTLGINATGQVAYVGYLDGSTASGVFLGDGTTQKVIALAGQAAPGGGIFTGFGLARANKSGAVVFGAHLDGNQYLNGLFISDGTDIIRVAVATETVNGGGGGLGGGGGVVTAVAKPAITNPATVVNGQTLAGIGIDPKAFNNLSQVLYQGQFSTGYEIILFAPQLSWRTNGNGNWDDSTNSTSSLAPCPNNDVNIAPTSPVVITGPTGSDTASSLTLSGAGISQAGTGTVDLNVPAGGSLTVTNGTTVTGGAVLGLGSGSTLAGYGGITVISGGTLNVGGGSVTSSNPVSVTTGGSLTADGGTLSLGGTLTISTGASFSGDATIILTGGSVVNSGSLLLVGANNPVTGMAKSGTRAASPVAKKAITQVPSLVSTVNVTGNYAQTSTGMLQANLAGTGAGNYSQLVVSGNVTLAGTLQVRMVSNFISQIHPSDTFTLVSAGSVSGAFSNVANGGRIQTMDGLGSFQVNYTGQSVVLSNFIVANMTMSITGTDVQIAFPSLTGRTYTVQSSTDMQGWVPVQSGIVGDGTNKIVTISNGLQGSHVFFRVSAVVQ